MYRDKAKEKEASKRYYLSPKGRATQNRYRSQTHVKKKLQAYQQQWKQQNPEKARLMYQRSNHQCHYREPYEEKAKRLERQGGCCANPGCRTTNPGAKGWQTDHDHETGKVRGELCGGCNKALGFINDDEKRADGLADYLRTHKCATLSG